MAQPQVFPDTKIITLLESNSINSDPLGGEFSINLNEQLVLKEGDTLELDKVFVDTTPSEETFITITEEEQEITIKHGMYLTDMIPNDASSDGATPPVLTPVLPAWGSWSKGLADRPDGKKYILQNEELAFANQKLDWEQGNNQFAAAGLPEFKTEFTPLVPEDNDGFEYIITALVPADATPVDLASTAGFTLDTKYYMNGHCRLIATGSSDPLLGAFEFYYYNRYYTPPGGVFGVNDHQAVLTRWTNGKSGADFQILGWKIKANPDTTETNVGRLWQFLSDAQGYNYFDTGGTEHMIEIVEFAMVLDHNFSPVIEMGQPQDLNPLFPFFPGYTFTWYDPRTQRNNSFTKKFDARAYDPVTVPIPGPSAEVTKGGMILLQSEVQSKLIPYEGAGGRATYGLPVGRAKDKKSYPKTGWESDDSNGFNFYKLSSFQDPFARDSQLTIPRIVISADHMPVISTWYYDKNGKPYYTGFVNYNPGTESWATTNAQGDVKMQTNSKQILHKLPVINPVAGGRVFNPREYSTTFKINPGKYTNGDLAQILTDAINANKSPVIGLSNNPAGPGIAGPGNTGTPEGTKFEPLVNSAGYSSSYFFQTTYELMQQADGYTIADESLPIPLTRYPNDYVYSKTAIPPRILQSKTLAAIPAPLPVSPSTNPATNVGTQPYFLSEDAYDLFQFKADNVQPFSVLNNQRARNVGASEVSILFDETEQAFTIAQAHTNIVAGGQTGGAPATEPAVQLIQAKGDNPTSYFGNQVIADTYSGIFFTALEPQSLWFDKMKLNRSLLVNIGANNHVISNFTDTRNSDSGFSSTTAPQLESVLCSPMRLNNGENITGIFNGVDILVNKIQAEAGDPSKEVPNSFAVQPEGYSLLVATDTLVSLVGDSFVNATEDDPYYAIEISGINHQDIFGQTHKNSLIQGVVGKFYSNGNFTQSENSGFGYTHKGEPMIIRSINVRILDSKGKLERGLGRQSALILKLSTDK